MLPIVFALGLLQTSLLELKASLPPENPAIESRIEIQSTVKKPRTSDTHLSVEEMYKKIEELSVIHKQDYTLAKRIIECEGIAYKKIGNNKNINKQGVHWSSDIGWWQINDYYHEASALKLGYNIHNELDNLEYGMLLLATEGTKPWEASKKCWKLAKYNGSTSLFVD